MSGQLDPIQLMKTINELEYKINALATIQTGGIWTAYTPTPTGFSATTLAAGKYCVVGNLCTVHLRLDGTSDSTSFNALLPIAAATMSYSVYITSALAIDNGTQVTTASTFQIASAATSVIFIKGVTTTTASWTASGRKLITGLFSYEI